MKRKIRPVEEIHQKQMKRLAFFHKHPWILYPLFIFAGAILLGGTLVLVLSRNLPSLTELEHASDPYLVTRIYSADGKILDELYREKRIKVPIARMPDYLVHATLASEDRRFMRHWGLDFRRITKAILVDIASLKKREGASTLTQQLARKIYLTPKKSWIRKIREQLTALQIERTYTKTEIVEMYLNRMEFGRGAHGVQAASLAFFRKNVEDLEIQEAALLIGLLQMPYGYYSPDRDMDAALKRRNVILKSMVEFNALTQGACDSLSQLPLGVIRLEDEGNKIAPYFCEYVRKQLYDRYGEQLLTGGLSIYTTLDTRVQACADSAINAFVPGLQKTLRERMVRNRSFAQWADPPVTSPAEITKILNNQTLLDSLLEVKATLQCALTALNTTNGHILAMVGGRDFTQSKWNRATQMARQPGSSFKAIVYTVAIENKYPPYFELLNQPVVLIMADGTRWSPQNYDGSTGGPTTLREALKRSLNLVSVRLVQEVIPPAEIVRYARFFGLTTQINPYDAIALGSDVVIPLEMNAAFNVFANHGIWVEPVAILRVEDKYGNILEEAVPKRHDVMREETAYIMTDMLTGTLSPGGTGSAARSAYRFYRPAAGKTGTTNDYRNAWFFGFTPQISAGFWVGFDDERIPLGDNMTGAVAALPVWAPFMRMAHDTLELPLADFTMPSGVMRVKICKESKLLASEYCPDVWDDIITKEMEPTSTCTIHTSPEPDRDRSGRRQRIY